MPAVARGDCTDDALELGAAMAVVAFRGDYYVFAWCGAMVVTRDWVTFTVSRKVPAFEAGVVNGAVVVDGGQTLLAVGDGGGVATSPDGVTWTLHNSTVNSDLNGVVLGPNNTVVAVGGDQYDSAVAVVSADGGRTWTKTFEISTGLFADVHYSLGVFLTMDTVTSRLYATTSSAATQWRAVPPTPTPISKSAWVAFSTPGWSGQDQAWVVLQIIDNSGGGMGPFSLTLQRLYPGNLSWAHPQPLSVQPALTRFDNFITSTYVDGVLLGAVMPSTDPSQLFLAASYDHGATWHRPAGAEPEVECQGFFKPNGTQWVFLGGTSTYYAGLPLVLTSPDARTWTRRYPPAT